MNVIESDELYGVAFSGGKAEIAPEMASILAKSKCVEILSSESPARVQMTREGYECLWGRPSFQKRVLERFKKSWNTQTAEAPLVRMLVDKGLLKEGALPLLGVTYLKLTEEGDTVLRGLEARQGVNKPRGPSTAPFCS